MDEQTLKKPRCDEDKRVELFGGRRFSIVNGSHPPKTLALMALEETTNIPNCTNFGTYTDRIVFKDGADEALGWNQTTGLLTLDTLRNEERKVHSFNQIVNVCGPRKDRFLHAGSVIKGDLDVFGRLQGLGVVIENGLLDFQGNDTQGFEWGFFVDSILRIGLRCQAKAEKFTLGTFDRDGLINGPSCFSMSKRVTPKGYFIAIQERYGSFEFSELSGPKCKNIFIMETTGNLVASHSGEFFRNNPHGQCVFMQFRDPDLDEEISKLSVDSKTKDGLYDTNRPDRELTIEGFYLNGNVCGQGVVRLHTGQTLTGELRTDPKTGRSHLQGKGKVEFPININSNDVVSAEGHFENGRLTAWGCMCFKATLQVPTGSIMNEGEMKNYKLHGIGKSVELHVSIITLKNAKSELKTIKEQQRKNIQENGPDPELSKQIKHKEEEFNNMYTLCKGYWQHGMPRHVMRCGKGHPLSCSYIARREHTAYQYAYMSARIKVLWGIVRSKRLGLLHPIAYYWFSLIHRPDEKGKAPPSVKNAYEEDF